MEEDQIMKLNSKQKEQARQILKAMTLEEKIAQIQCVMTMKQTLPADDFPAGMGEICLMAPVGDKHEFAEIADRIHLDFASKGTKLSPMLHTEGLTGLSFGESTYFPTAIGMGATFDPDLVEEEASVIHDQTRAIGYNQLFSPVLDVCRDPRWGRIGETYGEDPTLSAMIGTAYVKGVQGTEGDMVCATGKHFLGYGMGSGGLNMATASVSEREIREVYAKPFQAAMTEAGMMSIMNSYGTINGEMVIGSKRILTDLLRGEMEFDGLVVSDYASVEHLVDHRLAEDLKTAGVQALKAGLDSELPNPVAYKTEYLVEAVANGELDEAIIDRSALRVIEAKIACGLLDHPEHDESRMVSYHSEKASEIARRAARESIVLLKNDGVLPLRKEKQKVALIGPHADSIRLMFGGYTSIAGIDMMIGGSFADQAGMEANVDALQETFKLNGSKPTYPGSSVEMDSEDAINMINQIYTDVPTIRRSLKLVNPDAEITYVRGCDVAGFDRSRFDQAIAAAQDADVVIMTIGGKYGWGGSCTVGEGIDTDTILDLGAQNELAELLCETGKPVILVHMNARPFANEQLAEKASAVMEAWFPGSTGGMAIADVIYGDYNPAGRLSATAARSVGQIPVYSGQFVGNSYYKDECPTVSARYVDSTTEPLYHFGYGLSYTEFAYSDIQCSDPSINADETVTISCKVKNVGKMDGEEVVQLYVSDDCASMLRPAKEFAGAKRVALKAGEEKKVSFTVRADQFAFVGLDDKWIVEKGSMTARIGGASNDLPLETKFFIENTADIRPARRGFFAKAIAE